MKTLFLSCCLVLLGLAPPCFGQVVRYRSADKRTWTSQQVDSMVQAKNNDEKMKRLGIVFDKQITNTITRPDTVIHEFVLNGANAGVRKNRDRYTAFIGRPLPPFTLPDLKGKMLKSEELRGKPLVINMWFTTCGPCIAEMPALNRIQREKTGVTFLAMTYESPEKVKAFLQKHVFTFRHAVSAQTYCDQFTQNYPLSIFVNRQGLITAVLEGMPQMYDYVKKAPSDTMDDKAFYAALKQIE